MIAGLSDSFVRQGSVHSYQFGWAFTVKDEKGRDYFVCTNVHETPSEAKRVMHFRVSEHNAYVKKVIQR